MYLSNEETSLLTDAVKYFEVGFRSYIAETILNKYNTIDSYRNAVNGKRCIFSGFRTAFNYIYFLFRVVF